MEQISIWAEYFEEIKEKYKESTEHTFRTPFENVLNEIKSDKKTKIIHEQKRVKGFGAPDFRVEKEGSVIGYVETKPLDENLDKVLKSQQIKKYLSVNPNLVLTNYREFILILDSEIIERNTLFYLTDLDKKKSKLNNDSLNQVSGLLSKLFMLAKPLSISNANTLAVHMAERAKILKEYIHEILETEDDDRFSRKVLGLYEVFRKTLIEDLSKEEFADAYAQTVLYGYFLAYLQSGSKITTSDASNFIPTSFKVIKEFFDVINDYEMPSHIKWIFTEVVNLINNIDLEGIYKSISFKQNKNTHQKDPYIYFYETFLGELDPENKKKKGVYYTPLPVVSFISRSVDLLLNSKFNKSNGFADPSVTVLDFASGTGTFLVSIFEIILEKINKDKGLLKSVIKDHMLKNFYGFEYLVAPYAVSHLKLSQLLSDNGYILEKEDKLEIYLTDTLDNSEHQIDYLMPSLTEEGKEANEIKLNKNILVVTGNPPYNIKSRNNKDWIMELMKSYKPEDEKNIQPLNDDYIKFIRYAHWKISQSKKGIIGIITNNSYLNGIIHRKIRGQLLKDFDEIYILNLHGSAKVEEEQDNEIDENVFDIQQGVAISMFVKSEEQKTKCKVFYKDFFGKRENKEEGLSENDINTIDWDELHLDTFNIDFRNTRWGKYRFKDNLDFFVPLNDTKLVKNYGDFWGLTDIFVEFSGGVKTHRDHFLVGFNIQELEERFRTFESPDINYVMKELKLRNTRDWNLEEARKKTHDIKISNFINDYSYKPLDNRKIIYNVDLIERGTNRYNMMQNFFIDENVGIVFKRSRYLKSKEFYHVFVVSNIVDGNYLDDQTYVSPLYINDENAKNQSLFEFGDGSGIRDNFTTDFRNFIATKYSFHPKPIEILGYIYSILFSPTFRKTYLELLKLDFPRVPFVSDLKKFKQLSEVGMELIDHHLMKKSYSNNETTFPTSGSDVVDSVKFLHKHSIGRVQINKEQYFDNISEEIWEFQIGGYQVLDKWLKSRKGRQLSYPEIETFKQVVGIIDYTLNQMRKIDEVISDDFT